MWNFELDGCSPTRLRSSPTAYDFPGDRFIPNRSLMDLDQAHSLLTTKSMPRLTPNSQFSEVYRRKLEEKITLDSEGRPFRMLVFRGSPKSSRKSIRYIDEIRSAESEEFDNNLKQFQNRRLPKGEARILDAPNLRNDFYLNIMDWGKNNILAIALGSELYLWNADNRNVLKLFRAGDDDFPTSVAWSQDAKILAIGFMSSKLLLWDVETSNLVRTLEGHSGRVAAIDWNHHNLTSGSHDRSIINHDVRSRNSSTSRVEVHSEEVCGLKWSTGGNFLASGGNENLVYIWEISKMSSSKFLYRFNGHRAAVKALAWSPYQYNILASGGGTEDGCIKIWNTQKGTCVKSIDTKAQICGLEWNRHHKEILSGHGFSRSQYHNQLCLWKYPSMTKVGELQRHTSRVLHLSQSPDGLTVASAGADETLRFWEVFGPPIVDNSRISDLDGLLSLKVSPIR